MTSREEMLCLDDDHISSIELTTREELAIRHRGMTNEEPHERIVIYLSQSGLYGVTFLREFKVMTTLISALIERWRPKTYTFYLPCGKVTITLEDVAYQLGVPINGMPLVLRNTYSLNVVISNLLGNEAPTDVIDGLRIRMMWLERDFRVDEQSTKQEVIYAARAYLMTLIGGILLSDKSNNLVHIQYLPIMEDFTVCRQYSWGYSILTFLYHELCKVTVVVRGKKVDVAGCLVWLQSWAWYRLPFMTPITSAPMEFPLAAR
ncbi:protein MAINTENANCE OF MERISTEMS-like [Hibiscus syriacus]|uniref:protein MAINTENANCE OF MERISTEMS-like n=1 Tax=Hibiscus syriacus TaxID=106335 RepID=UPI001924CB28|nr:protein MAINTENANCE OF MERISTEMS-like [Hibiscus syriacus]